MPSYTLTAPNLAATRKSALIHQSVWIFFMILSSFQWTYGQSKNFSINKKEPDWKVNVQIKNERLAARDISDGYYLSFYGNQNHVEKQEDYNHIIKEIASEAGVQNGSQISVNYDPAFQKLIFHKINVWRNGKSSDRLKASNFKFIQSEKELSEFIYNGTYDALMVLEDIRKGDRIEFSYTLKGINPIYGQKYSSTFYLEGSSSIGHLYTNLITNKSRKIFHKNFNLKDAPKIRSSGDLNIYEWETTMTKTHRVLDYEPSWYNPLKRTQVTEYKNWSEVVEWGLTVTAYPKAACPLLDQKIAELKSISKNNVKKYVELSTRFVQDEIRYMGIEVGVYSHRPNAPEAIMRQRYGDCKDKSLLLVNFLRASGLNAYLSYVSTYNNIQTNTQLPSPFAFNHVIVMLEYKGRKIWIDPTISHQRNQFDDFYAPNYGYALVLKRGVDDLEKIDSKTKGKLISNMTFKLADTLADEKTNLEIFSVYTHNYADEIRAQIAEQGTEAIEKNFLEYFSKMYPEIEPAQGIIIEDNEEENIVEITESYEIKETWTKDDQSSDRIAYFYGDMVSSELRKIKSKNRNAPIELKEYLNIEQNITVELPYPVSEDNTSFKIERDQYLFDIYHSQKDSTIKFSYTYQNLADHIEASQSKQYYEDINKISEHSSYSLSREISENGLSSSNNSSLIYAYVLAIILAILICYNLYFRSYEYDIEKIANAAPIGGWLILLGIRVTLLPIVLLVKPFTIEFFSDQIWNKMTTFDGSFMLKGGFIVESISFAGLGIYGVFCAVLFFKRRNDFPMHFSGFMSAYILFICLDFILTSYISTVTNQPELATSNISSSIGGIISAVIIILYLKKSDRVGRTFVYTYPKSNWESELYAYHDNYFKNYDTKTQQSTDSSADSVNLHLDSNPINTEET